MSNWKTFLSEAQVVYNNIGWTYNLLGILSLSIGSNSIVSWEDPGKQKRFWFFFDEFNVFVDVEEKVVQNMSNPSKDLSENVVEMILDVANFFAKGG